MSNELKKLQDGLAQFKAQPKPVSEKIYTICGLALYPIWGLFSSALLFNSNFLHGQRILSIIVGITFAGLLPVALHLYEVLRGKTYFEWKVIFISISLGGIPTLFLGTILQFLLLLCGIHSLFGLRIDTWYWRFPYYNP